MSALLRHNLVSSTHYAISEYDYAFTENGYDTNICHVRKY